MRIVVPASANTPAATTAAFHIFGLHQGAQILGGSGASPLVPTRGRGNSCGAKVLCPEKTSSFDAKRHAFAAGSRWNPPVQLRGPHARQVRRRWAGACAAGWLWLAGPPPSHPAAAGD